MEAGMQGKRIIKYLTCTEGPVKVWEYELVLEKKWPACLISSIHEQIFHFEYPPFSGYEGKADILCLQEPQGLVMWVEGNGYSGFIIGKSQSRKNGSWGNKKGKCMHIIIFWWLKGVWWWCLEEMLCLPPDPAQFLIKRCSGKNNSLIYFFTLH